MLSIILSEINYFYVGFFVKYFDIYGGQIVDFKWDDFMIFFGFLGIKYNIYLYGLVWYQDFRQIGDFKVGSIFVLIFNIEKYSKVLQI